MPHYVEKTSGEKELFDAEKLKRSLKKAGADGNLIDVILREITAQQPQTTQEIHAIVSGFLQKVTPPIAARYNLKRALIELGPIGFPFEQFVAHILQAQDFHTKTNQIVRGACVEHEIDIITEKQHKYAMIECKFHNSLGIKTDIQVALYTQARFEDIKKTEQFHEAWIVTNTQFTSETIKYGTCMGIQLLGWNYPTNKGLAHIIDTLGIHPITALQELNALQKRELIKQGLVLCRDAAKYQPAFKSLGFTDQKIETIIKQAKAVCKL